MTIQLKDSVRKKTTVSPSTYPLQDDKFSGFIEAVDNGQNRLALEYAVYLVTELNNEIFHLNEKIDAVREEVRAAESTKVATPAKKATKKSAPKSTAKDAEDTPEDETPDKA